MKHRGVYAGKEGSVRGQRLRAVFAVLLVLGIGRVFGFAVGEKVRTLTDHTDAVRTVAFSPDGRLLVSGSKDSTIKAWDVAAGEVLITLLGHAGMVRSVAFSPDGTLLASAGADGAVKLWDVDSWAELLTLAHPDEVNSVTFSPDGALLATACDDTHVRLWDVATGKEVLVLSGHADLVWLVAFSPDGQWVASGSGDGTARLWEVHRGRSVSTLVHDVAGHRVSVNTVAFSSDGATLATGSDANVVELWKVPSGEKVRMLQGHQARVWSVAFSPDGAWLASGSADGSIILWTARAGRRIHTLAGRAASVFSVAFSPHSTLLASGSADGTIHLWLVEPPPPTPVVLAWIPCTDEAQEYANVTRALGFEPDATRTRNPDELAPLLSGVRVLLIPEQENCSESGLARLGADCAEVLMQFLDQGGTIVGMSYTRGAEDILRGAGILPGVDDARGVTGDTVTVVAPDHPLALGVVPSFTAKDGSTGFSGVSAEAVVVIQHASGQPVVFVEQVGAGTVVMLGFDFYSYNPAMVRLLQNAMTIAGPQTMVRPAQIRVDGEPVTLDSSDLISLIRPGSRAGDPILFELPVRCPDRGVPSGVILKLVSPDGTPVQMAELGLKKGVWSGTCTVPLPSEGRSFDIMVAVQCTEGSLEQKVGVLALVEPTGYVFEDVDGDGLWDPAVDRPIAGAEVTLEMRVDGEWILVNPEPAATWQGFAAWPGVYPRANPQLSNPDGYYGWDVPDGEYRIRGEARGYNPATSRSVTVPPRMADLNLPFTRMALTLLLQDDLPWGDNVVVAALNDLGVPFEVNRSVDLASLDLSAYGHIIIPSDQPQRFYDALASHMSLIEAFVRNGGILQFHAATSGVSPVSSLPGGSKYSDSLGDPNTIVLPEHPVVKGVPSPFRGRYASHGYFTDLPLAARVITINPAGEATTAEYRLGSGVVLATAVTLEWGVSKGHAYAPMLENLIRYARGLSR